MTDSISGGAESDPPGDDLLDEVGEIASSEQSTWGLPGAVAAAGFGIATCVLSAISGLGTLTDMGTGMWPFLLGVVITIAATVLVIRSRRRPDATRTRPRRLPRAWRGLAVLVCYPIVFVLAGFAVASLVTLIAWFRWVSGERWIPVVVWSVFVAAGAYVVFVIALGVRFPAGLLLTALGLAS